MADDTYATIGLSGPASSSDIAGAADPSIVEDAAQPVTPFFTTPGATQLLSNTLTGSSYYVLNTASNGLPDADMRVLVMQVTTTGSISGTMNYQVFPLGVGADQVQVSVDFDGAGTFGGGSVAPACGCTDASACNYDDTACYFDDSCFYAEEGWYLPEVGSGTVLWGCEGAGIEGYIFAENQECTQFVIDNDWLCLEIVWDSICQDAYICCLSLLDLAATAPTQ